MKKTLKWIRRILFILVGVVFLIKFLSTILFSIIINTQYSQYRWKGKWKSSEEMYREGYMVASLPYSIPVNKVFKAESVIFEHFYTFEHSFSNDKMNLTASIFPNSQNRNGVLLNDSLSIGFQASLVGPENHQMELNGSINLTRTLITGSYRSISPNDMGTFSLSRR